jgi:hypothetical protein
VGAAVVAATACLVVACGSSSNGGAESGNFDGGFDGGTLGTPDADANFPGEGGEAGEAAAPLVTSVLFVNAIPSGFSGGDSSLRFCWSTGSGFGGQLLGDAGGFDGGFEPFPAGTPMPESNFPGVALGSAVLLSDAAALTGMLTLYAIRAIKLEQYHERDSPCDKLICPSSLSGCLDSTDYFKLPPIAVQRGAANLVVVEGCPPQDTLASPSRTGGCGASYDPALGNLHAEVVSVVPSKPAEAGIEVQVAQFSQGLANVLGDAGAATVSFAQLAQDGSAGTTALSTITTVGNEGQLAPSLPVSLPLGGLLASYGDVGIRLDLPAGEAGAPSYFLTLAQAQQLVAPAMDPRLYYGGLGTYVIAIVGDPSAPAPFATGPEAGTYDGTGLHFVIAQAQP